MKIYKLCALIFVSLIVLVTPVDKSRGCAYFGEDPDVAYFYDQSIIDAGSYEPFLFSQHIYHRIGPDPRNHFDFTQPNRSDDSLQVTDNVEEWRNFCRNIPSPGDINSIVYGCPVQSLQQIKIYLTHKLPGDTLPLHGNSLVDYWNSHPSKETRDMIDYLIFAKTCEAIPRWTYDGSSYGWVQSPPQKTDPQIRSVLLIGKKGYRATGNRLLKLRYAYQFLKLEHYSGHYARAAKLYDSLIKPLHVQSVIAYWAIANKAGCLRRLGNEAEAAYLFSRVFDVCRSRRYTAFENFRIKNDSIWNACSALCKNNHERATLFFLRGINFESNALEEMQQLYTLEPASLRLEILMVREVAKMEHAMFKGTGIISVPWYYHEENENTKENSDYLSRLDQFYQRCVRERRVRTPAAWEISLGYLQYLEGMPEGALKTYADLRTHTKMVKYLNDAALFELATRISALKLMTPDVEQKMFASVDSSKNDVLFRYFMNNAAKRYTQQGDSLKWLFCKKTLREITLVPTPSMVESLLTFERKPEKTRLEQYFLSGVPHGFLDEYGDPYSDNDLQPIDKPGNYLREVKATLFLKDDRLDSALALFKTLRLQDLKTLRADPFNYRINDFSDSPYKDSSLSYTKLSMVERMVGLYDKLKNDPKNAGLYHFLLGNAYFNMTFLGNVPEAIDNRGRTFKDDYEIYYEARKSIEGLGYFDYKPRNLDWSKALEHYKKGMAAAEEKGDKELAAKCCFMAAKCEQNNYYVNEKPNSIVKGARYHTYFKIMKSNFSETEYYKEAIKECEYFRVYAAWH